MKILRFRPYFRPSKKEKPPKHLIISSFRGFFEVSGGTVAGKMPVAGNFALVLGFGIRKS
jgi:hypothetical protein